MAKPELGTKRLCANCGAKFYDLNKDPILCPKCETVFVPPVAARPRPEQAPAVVPAPAEEEVAVPEVADAELISLEDAEKETEGAKAPVGQGDEDEVEGETLDDAAFIVPEEQDEEDVTDIIGEGIENDEET